MELLSDLETQIVEVAHYFEELAPAVLTAPCTPSLHPGGRPWTAKDHLSHIVFAEENFHRLVARALAGDRTPLSFRGETPQERDAYVNRENQIDVDAHQSDELQQLLVAFREERLVTISTARSLEAPQFGMPLIIEGHQLALVQLFRSAHVHARLHVQHVQRALADGALST